MKIHHVTDLSNVAVVDILKNGLSGCTDESSIKNYHPDFSNDPANLFYILNDPNGRYQNGDYLVLEEDGIYICSTGWNEYEYDRSIALVMTRTYINPKYRNRYYLGTLLLPEILSAVNGNYQKIWMTCNQHNKSIVKWFERNAAGKKTNLFAKWPAIYENFKPIGMHTIYFTEQYIMEWSPDE